MNIILMTNTYKPIMGGLERSVEVFSKSYREKGDRVLIVAPEFENMEPETDVIRIPAIQNFNGTDFSIQLPVAGALAEMLGDFKPDIVHAQHPFLIGDTALRLASKYNVPLVFTHHTLYEQNTHYVPGDSEVLKRFVIQLSTGYANLADHVFVPSESVMKLLRERGVETPMDVVPTGIETARFSKGDGKKIRQKAGIPPRAFVVGHIGRFAPEKNLEFMAKAVIGFLKKKPAAHFLAVGKGPSEELLKNLFQEAGLSERLHLTGSLSGQDLVDAYHAMDIFIFASQSETQGIVLIEAMAAGTPVVAVDASGVREVVRDTVNGRLLPEENVETFVSAIEWMEAQPLKKWKLMESAALDTAKGFEMDKCSDRARGIYLQIIQNKEFVRRESDGSAWSQTVRVIQAHWELTKNLTKATAEAILSEDPTTPLV